MIPMRDGVKLYTQVYVPKATGERYPILLTRTPYSVKDYGPNDFKAVLGPTLEFTQEGYIVAYQDVRGKFRSEGKFFHHPTFIEHKSRPEQVDESSDAYDTIDWLVKNIPNNNGRVGTWGVSAAGYTTSESLLEAHPALKAASPQASPGIEFLGDDYKHYGAFRMMTAWNWTWTNGHIRDGVTTVPTKPFDYGTPDGYKFYLDLGSVANANKKYFRDEVPAWNEYMEHPDYDDFWQAKDVAKNMKNVTLPVLNVIGWFDDQDYFGPWAIYKAITRLNPQNQNHVVVGPWSHGGWSRGDGEQLGDINFESKTGEYFRHDVELPFFNFYLKDKGRAPTHKVMAFETGRNVWRQYDEWPPRGAVSRELFLHANGRLSFDPPGAAEGYDEYVSDPARPVPFSQEIRTSDGNRWIIDDQRFAARRPDVLVYESQPLTEDVTIAGSIVAELFFASTGTDADFVVKLIDVLPSDTPDPKPNPAGVRLGDYQMLLASEVFRAKYRNDFAKPEPLQPGVVSHLAFDLLDKLHTFKRGHRMMVQIQSSWFPMFDRNPQRFVPNIEQADDSVFQKATQRIYHATGQATHLVINVLKEN